MPVSLPIVDAASRAVLHALLTAIASARVGRPLDVTEP
jgi:hypothetical protein